MLSPEPNGLGATSSGALGWNHWDVICIAARIPAHAEAYKRELQRRKRADGFANAPPLILAVSDPGEVSGAPTAFRIGSGGATLNALLLIAEHLSALAGENNVDTSNFNGKRLLVLNVGSLDQRVPAFSRLPTPLQPGRIAALSTIDLLLGCLSGLAAQCPPGLFVVSSQDSFVMLSQAFVGRFGAAARRSAGDGRGTATAIGLALPVDVVAEKYVAYAHDDDGSVRRMLLRASKEELAQIQPRGAMDGCVSKVTGVVFFNQAATIRLFNLAVDSTFEACTYYGIDNGAQPKGFAFFLDLVASLARDVPLEDFGRPAAAAEPSRVDGELRRRLWQLLHGHIHLSVVTVEPCDRPQCLSVQSSQDYAKLVTSLEGDGAGAGVEDSSEHCQNTGGDTDPSARILSSVLSRCRVGPHTIIESCTMDSCRVGAGSVCAGCKGLESLEVPPGLFLQQLGLLSSGTLAWEPGSFCVVTMHPEDRPACHRAAGTFMGQAWEDVLRHTGITATDLWGEEAPGARQTLHTARLFPVVTGAKAGSLAFVWLEYAACWKQEPRSMGRAQLDLWRRQWVQVWRRAARVSINEAHAIADVAAELEWQDSLISRTNTIRARQLLLNHRNMPLRHILHDEVHRQRWGLLEVFDAIAAGEDTPVDVVARALAQIAEVLAAFGGTEGGLRSGTARNPQWQSALMQLAGDDPGARRTAVLAMRDLRSQWITGGPVALIRAARHYEAAAQVMILRAVSTCSEFIKIGPAASPAVQDRWFVAETPARIDLAGGWTDTPPVCYDYGGTVVNMALLVDGKRPLGAMARRLPDRLELVFEIRSQRPRDDGRGEGSPSAPVVCRSLEDLDDHNSPSAPAALLKCCALCCGVASVAPGAAALEEQLRRMGGGLHLVSWSTLPQGSGLGSSSILAGVAIKAIVTAFGLEMDESSIIHAVQNVEQMLTTGGGWQDQVGGLLGGVKITRSAARLPLHVVPEVVPVSPEFVEALSNHMVLVFTGRPRLAKHLLQNVIRQWFSRMPEICSNVRNLVANAEAAAQALRAGDLAGLGACLNAYWSQKKTMAPGSEPRSVTEWRESMSEGLLGFTLAGAGGGGFAMLLTKEPKAHEWVRQTLVACPGMEGSYVCEATVDFEGMIVR